MSALVPSSPAMESAVPSCKVRTGCGPSKRTALPWMPGLLDSLSALAIKVILLFMRPYHVAPRVVLNLGGHTVVPCPGARCRGNYQIAQMDLYGGDNRKWRVPWPKYAAISVMQSLCSEIHSMVRARERLCRDCAVVALPRLLL